jgi:hypothetical protein
VRRGAASTGGRVKEEAKMNIMNENMDFLAHNFYIFEPNE